jgi:hypothetical protein
MHRTPPRVLGHGSERIPNVLPLPIELDVSMGGRPFKFRAMWKAIEFLTGSDVNPFAPPPSILSSYTLDVAS